MWKDFKLIVAVAVVLCALFFVSVAKGAEPDASLVYSYEDATGVIMFHKDACPYLDPKEKFTKFFHIGAMVLKSGQTIAMCWARRGGEVIVVFPNPQTGELMQMRGPEALLKREGAPIPQAMDETSV